MSEIINCFSQAELALASYANLQAGIPDPLKLQDNGDGLSAKQAELFAQTYSVVTQYNDTLAEGGQGTGLSATVFVDKASNGLTLAIRGTERSDSRDLSTGAVMLAEGVAYDQVLALYNWWLRATTPTTDTALQYAIAAGPIDPQEGFQFGTQWLKILPPVAGSGELVNVIGLDPDHKLDVTGHSLGGHLAMVFSTLFEGFTAHAIAFNAPGFKNNTANQAFFAALGGTVPTGGPITNVIADEANIGGNPMNIVAGANSQPGTVVTIAIESQYRSDEPNKPAAKNHSQQTLTDALAVYALLSKLDPNLSTASFKGILNAATTGTAAGLERIIDAIERVFGINSAELPAGNNNRDDLYRALYALDKDDSPLASVFGQVKVTLAPDTIGTRARGDFSALVSLITLSPIVLSGDATLLESTLGAAWGAELAQWKADQALTPEEFESGQANYSQPYLDDRARMLAKLILGNQQDALTSGQTMYLVDTQSGNTDLWKFIDETSGRQIVASPPIAWANHEIYFGDGQNNTHFGGLSDDTLYGGRGDDILDGSNGADYIEGNADNDKLAGGEGRAPLFGGAGNDVLAGGKENDVLNGGLGDDTYTFANGDGWDWIDDQDGSGHIEYDGITLGQTTPTYISANVWQEQIGINTFTYTHPTTTGG